MIHLFARRQYLLRRAVRRGVALFEAERVVVKFRLRNAGAGILQPLQLCHHGHHVALYLRAVGGHIVQRIAKAVHADGAKRHKIFIPHGLRLCGAVFHKLVVQAVEFLPVRVEPGALGLIGRLAHGAVCIRFIFGKLCHGERLALEGDLRRGV